MTDTKKQKTQTTSADTAYEPRVSADQLEQIFNYLSALVKNNSNLEIVLWTKPHPQIQAEVLQFSSESVPTLTEFQQLTHNVQTGLPFERLTISENAIEILEMKFTQKGLNPRFKNANGNRTTAEIMNLNFIIGNKEAALKEFQAELDHFQKFLSQYSTKPGVEEHIMTAQKLIVSVPDSLTTPEELPNLLAAMQTIETNIIKKLNLSKQTPKVRVDNSGNQARSPKQTNNFKDQSSFSEQKCEVIIQKLRGAVVVFKEDLSKNKKNEKIHDLLIRLYKHLEKPATLKTIKGFYSILNDTNTEGSQTNFEMIQSIRERSSLRFALGVTFIALTIITGIIPGLILLSVLYQKGYDSPIRLFQPLSRNFKESIDQVEREVGTIENQPQGRK